MKKINYIVSVLSCLVLFNSCAGYDPIFKSTNVQFKIENHYISGDKSLGDKLYSKLDNMSKAQKDTANSTPIILFINLEKKKEEMSADSAGKTIEYKIILNAEIEIKNSNNDEQIINKVFNSSTLYRVQDQYSETIKIENRTTAELIQKIYQDILISLAGKILP